MCIGIPMQVVSARDTRAVCEGRGERRHVDTALVGECRPGDWLLVFLDSARERIDRARAIEIDSALDLLAGALGGSDPDAAPAFTLPSSLDAAQLAALTGAEPAIEQKG